MSPVQALGAAEEAWSFSWPYGIKKRPNEAVVSFVYI